MAKKNKLSTGFKASLDKSGWANLVDPMKYKLVDGPEAYKLGIVPSGMSGVNCVAIGASGSMESTIMYFANYFRVDGTEIDQEPYFELYESGSAQPGMYGIFHHANFPGRTELLGPTEIARIAASGSSVDICFTSKPNKPDGTLEELRIEGKIDGFDYTWGQGMNAMGANSSVSGETQSGSIEDNE